MTRKPAIIGHTVFYYAGEWHGDLTIQPHDGETDAELTIPARDVFGFVAEVLREEMVAEIEDATRKTILGIWSRRGLENLDVTED